MIIEHGDNVRRILNKFFKNSSENNVKEINALPVVASPKENKYDGKMQYENLEYFDLHGDNWLDKDSDKQIAILIHFMPWKRQYIQSFLPEYRLAFARSRTQWVKVKESLDKFDKLVFIIWGMNDRADYLAYAENRSIPIYRMEDGFIRSVELGKNHTEPLSLVLDKKGIYFNTENESELENLLNTYDFDNSPKLLQQAAQLRSLQQQLKISKYNLPSLVNPGKNLGLKIKKRILVIGQVEHDASIKYGGAEGWTNIDLIKLAKNENLDAEIVYRPHPDIVTDLESNALLKNELKQYCTTILEQVNLIDLFGVVDHVYTLTSLAGFEALIYGLPVTVIGKPFYSGWGLTDDRAMVDRRSRKLTLDELYAIAYLIYPRYCYDGNNNIANLLAAISHVYFDRENAVINQKNQNLTINYAHIIGSDYWFSVLVPEILNKLKKEHGNKFSDKIYQSLPLQTIFYKSSSTIYRRAMMCTLLGKLQDFELRQKLITFARTVLPLKNFQDLVCLAYQLNPNPELLIHLAWSYEQADNVGEASKIYEYAAGSVMPIILDKHFYKVSNYRCILAQANAELRFHNYEKAINIFCHMLIQGFATPDVYAGIAEVGKSLSDFEGAGEIALFASKCFPKWHGARLYVQSASCFSLAQNGVECFKALISRCVLQPSGINLVQELYSTLSSKIGDFPYSEAFQLICSSKYRKDNVKVAEALLPLHKFDEAIQLLLRYEPNPTNFIQYCIVLSQAYIFAGMPHKSKSIITQALKINKSINLIREGLRVTSATNDYYLGMELINELESKNILVSDLLYRETFLAQRKIPEAFQTYKNTKNCLLMKRVFPNKFINTLNLEIKPRNILLLASFGPGDEIRWTSFYQQIIREFSYCELYISCEPRLESILSRSFPQVNFVPIIRARNLLRSNGNKIYSNLPNSELCKFLDNDSLSIINSVDKFSIIGSMLGDIVRDESSFTGLPSLVADENKINYMVDQLKKAGGKKYIGLSWRSSVNSYVRSEHYLQIEDLLPLFEIDGVQFINLQYDECSSELSIVDEKYPGKIINFDEIDHFNDFESVAALMKSLDLVIAPATTVIELAGAVGVNSFLLSNSTKLHWRKTKYRKTDIWFNSIKHIEGAEIGNKKLLVDELVIQLSKLANGVKFEDIYK